jgi:formylglycine-generating enzyme required for sulfatase activity
MMLVSWHGANAYSLWANRLDWRCYRGDGRPAEELASRQVSAPPPPSGLLGACLPSESQWEYAARGATPQNSADYDAVPAPSCAGLHRSGDSYRAENIPARPVHERLGMSPFGLHHMTGNVWQWCRDYYAPDFYCRPEASRPDAQNAEPTEIRNERGGSWVGPESLASPSYRRGRPPAVRGRCLGFRCVGLMQDLP